MYVEVGTCYWGNTQQQLLIVQSLQHKYDTRMFHCLYNTGKNKLLVKLKKNFYRL